MAVSTSTSRKIRLKKATALEIFETLKISPSQIRRADRALAVFAPRQVGQLEAPARRSKVAAATKKRAKR